MKASEYDVFLSYSREELTVAIGLQRALERKFRQLPRALRGSRRSLRVFRDHTDLTAGHPLSSSLRDVITRSRVLVVLCSPNAKASSWVREEIEWYRSSRVDRAARVVPVLVDGDDPIEDHVLPAGITTDNLAVEMRPDKVATLEGVSFEQYRRHDAPLRVLAAILDGVGYAELQNRHARALQRVMRIRLSLATAAVVVLAVMAVVFYLQRETQRELRFAGVAAALSAYSRELAGGAERELEALLAHQAYEIDRTEAGGSRREDVFGALRATLSAPFFNTVLETGDPVTGAALGPHGRQLATATSARGGEVALWDLEQRNPQQRVVRTGLGDEPRVAASPDGRWLAVADAAEVFVYDMDSLDEPAWSHDYPNCVALVFDREAKRLAIAGGVVVMGTPPDDMRTTVELWAVPGWQQLAAIEYVGPLVTDVAFDPSGSQLAIAGDGVPVLWNAEEGQTALVDPDSTHMSAFAFSPDGRWLVGAGGFRATFWRRSSWQHEFEFHDWVGVGAAHRVSFSPDGRDLWVTDAYGELRHWPVHELVGTPRVFTAHADHLTSMAFAGHSTRFVTSDLQGRVRLWESAPIVGAEFRWRTTRNVLSLPPAYPGPNAKQGRPGAEAATLSTRATLFERGDQHWLCLERDGRPPQEIALPEKMNWVAIAHGDRYMAVSSEWLLLVFDAERADAPLFVVNWMQIDSEAPPTADEAGGWRAVALPRNGVAVRALDGDDLGRIVVPTVRPVSLVDISEHGDYLLTATRPPGRGAADFDLLITPLSIEGLAAETAARVRRGLTEREWNQYVGPETPYAPSCPPQRPKAR